MMLKTLFLLSCVLALCVTVQCQSISESDLAAIQQELGNSQTAVHGSFSTSIDPTDASFFSRVRNIIQYGRSEIVKRFSAATRRFMSFVDFTGTAEVLSARTGRKVSPSTEVFNILKILLREIIHQLFVYENGRSNPVVPQSIINFLDASPKKISAVNFTDVDFQMPHAIMNFWNTFMHTKFPNDLHTPQTLPWWRLILGTNNNLADRTVINSWIYLSILLIFCTISVISSLVPIKKIYSEDEQMTDMTDNDFEQRTANIMSKIDLNRYDNYPENDLQQVPYFYSKTDLDRPEYPIKRIKYNTINPRVNGQMQSKYENKLPYPSGSTYAKRPNIPTTEEGNSPPRRFLYFDKYPH